MEKGVDALGAFATSYPTAAPPPPVARQLTVKLASAPSRRSVRLSERLSEAAREARYVQPHWHRTAGRRLGHAHNWFGPGRAAQPIRVFGGA